MSTKSKTKGNRVSNLQFFNGESILEMESSNNSLSVISMEPESQHEQQSPTFKPYEQSPSKFIKVKPSPHQKQQQSIQQQIDSYEYPKSPSKKETIETSNETNPQQSQLKRKKDFESQLKIKRDKNICKEQVSEEKSSCSSEQYDEVIIADSHMKKPKKRQMQEKEEKMEKQTTNYKTFKAQGLMNLISSPVPQNCSLLCAIICRESFFSINSTYDLYLVNDKKKILTASRSKFQLKSSYQLKSVGENKLLGRVRANFTGTQFVVSSYLQEEKEVCWIGYNLNIFGFSPQRNLEIIRNSNKKMEKVPHFSQIKTYYDNGLKNKFQKFYSKRAQQKQGKYELDFHGKVNVPSRRNFILEDKEANESMLFGKKQNNIYMLEIYNPFSIIEAFGIAISNIDRKIFVH